MIICGGNECGTGDWSGPKPGDPNTNINIAATPAFGGIDISWSFPALNPHAVAHFILYRGATGTVENATRLAVVNGSLYYDKASSVTPVEWYYWVQVVSVNGTVGEMIGPARATARPTIEDMIAMLSQRIDSGVLSLELQEQIQSIELNRLGITAEMVARAASDDELGIAFNEVQAFSEGTRALLQTEVLARTTADSAFVDAVNTLYASTDEGFAGVQEQLTAHTDELASLGSYRLTTEATLNGSVASGQIGLVSKVEINENQLARVSSMYTVKVNAAGLVGGFGIYAHNNGIGFQEVQAGFDVDTFWIGKGGVKTKPFIVSGPEVFIDQAVIKKLTFSKLVAEDQTSLLFDKGKLQVKYIDVDNLTVKSANISGDLKSTNYIPGVAGWILKK